MILKKLWALISLLLASALIAGYLWWGKFQYSHEFWERITYLGCFFLLLSNHLIQGDTRKRLGLRVDNWRRAVKWYGSVTLALVCVILLFATFWGNPTYPGALALASYFLWAGIQQYFLQNFLRIRAEDFVARKEGPVSQLIPAIVAAAIFAGLHWPNQLLTILTFLAGLFWCLLFTQVPSFPAVWVSQAVLGIGLVFFFKTWPLDEFQVGREGHRFDYYGEGVIVSGGYDAQGSPFIATVPGWDLGVEALIRIFRTDGVQLSQWVAFPGFDFSARLDVGDLSPLAGDEVVAAPGPGSANPPLIRVFSTEGVLLNEFMASEIQTGFGAWVSVACGKLYVAPGPAPDAPPVVYEFTAEGEKLREWHFDETGFLNGLKATAVCTTCELGECDTRQIIVWGTEISVNPSTVIVLDLESGRRTSLETLPTTFGLNAAIADLGERGLAVAVSPGPLKGYPAWVQLYSFSRNFELIREFAPYTDHDMYGANLAALDIDGDGVDELAMGEGIGRNRPSTVRIVNYAGEIIEKWEAYP